jgi:hypothetical protein
MSPSSRGSRTEARETVRDLLAEYPRSYAAEAGIRLRNTPKPLYQLLVLATLLSTRIRANIAVGAARALFTAGFRTPARMADASWQQRVDALGEAGYRRYDERTSTQLGDGARLVLDRYRGDLRRLRREADGDSAAVGRLLREFPGVGSTGVDIFVREAQSVWPEFAPRFDPKAIDGARVLGLPETPEGLAGLVPSGEAALFASGLVRVALARSRR